MSIITSMLDTDFYKLTMQQLAWWNHRNDNLITEYEFKCRTPNINLLQFKEEITDEVMSLGNLRFHEEDLHYLYNEQIFTPGFIDYLSTFKLNPEEQFSTDYKNSQLSLKIRGVWHEAILYETYILPIVNEIYYRQFNKEDSEKNGEFLLKNKINKIKANKRLLEGSIIEFGTRRRFSKSWQRHVLSKLIDKVPTVVTSTSNVALAKEFDITPSGTMAHEFFQAYQYITHPDNSQKRALKDWYEFYSGRLGIALSDIFGFDAFLADFDKTLAGVYNGCRHDSGDPREWCHKLISHYQKLGINPMDKVAVFSDGLDIDTVVDLAVEFKDHIQVKFGVGTNLTNDMVNKNVNDYGSYSASPYPLSIVMKMISVNDQPVAKLSDQPAKTMCNDEQYLEYLKAIIDRKLARSCQEV